VAERSESIQMDKEADRQRHLRTNPAFAVKKPGDSVPS
jgi:hypothetical protein